MLKGDRSGDAAIDAGRRGEERALQHLQQAGLRLLQRNYRVARGPGARAGEIDLILQDPDGTVVFVEVRSRGESARRFGGAAASVGVTKQRRIAFAASCWLMRRPHIPPCRFDVVAIDGERVEWIRAAFDAP
jgi:putative endonuclease